MNRPRLLTTVRRSFHLRRRPLAALCAFVAILAGLLALTPAPASGVRVVVTTRDLPSGAALDASALAEVVLPAAALPEGAATTASALEGKILAGPATRNTIITSASVSAGERLAAPGLVVVSLPLPANGLGALVTPGTRLDLIGPDGVFVARDVRVLTAPRGDGDLFGASSQTALIEVAPGVAATLARLGQGSGLTIALQ